MAEPKPPAGMPSGRASSPVFDVVTMEVDLAEGPEAKAEAKPPGTELALVPQPNTLTRRAEAKGSTYRNAGIGEKTDPRSSASNVIVPFEDNLALRRDEYKTSSHFTTPNPVMFAPRADPPPCRITSRDVDAIKAFTMAYPNRETGGDLWGEWVPEGGCVVKAITGPGSHARHHQTAFYQDPEYLRAAGEYLAPHKAYHIGTWHSHHTIALPVPSAGDERTYRLACVECGRTQFIAFIAAIENNVAQVRPYFYEYDKRTRQVTMHKGRFVVDDSRAEDYTPQLARLAQPGRPRSQRPPPNGTLASNASASTYARAQQRASLPRSGISANARYNAVPLSTATAPGSGAPPWVNNPTLRDSQVLPKTEAAFKLDPFKDGRCSSHGTKFVIEFTWKSPRDQREFKCGLTFTSQFITSKTVEFTHDSIAGCQPMTMSYAGIPLSEIPQKLRFSVTNVLETRYLRL